MYSSFISARSDTSEEVNKRYIKSLQDQIKIRQKERLQLLKRLERAENNTLQQQNQFKNKLQDLLNRLQYQRSQKQRISEELAVKKEKGENRHELIKQLNHQSLQKSYKDKIQNLQKRLLLQKEEFLQKIQSYQKIISKSLLSPKSYKQNKSPNDNGKIKSVNLESEKDTRNFNSNNSNLQQEQLISQFKERIQSLEGQLKEQNKRLNILQHSNHQLRRQLMLCLEKEETVRKMLIQQRKRSKSKEYFLEKQKNLKINQKYLNRSRSKQTKLESLRINLNQKTPNILPQRKQDNLRKIRIGIVGSAKSSQQQNKQKMNCINLKNDLDPCKYVKKNISNRYEQKEESDKINYPQQNCAQEIVKSSLEGFRIQQKQIQIPGSDQKEIYANFIENVKVQNSPAIERIHMIKTNNQQDFSYSKYRISAQSLDQQQKQREFKRKISSNTFNQK